MAVLEGGCKRHLHLDVKPHLTFSNFRNFVTCWFVGLQITV